MMNGLLITSLGSFSMFLVWSFDDVGLKTLIELSSFMNSPHYLSLGGSTYSKNALNYIYDVNLAWNRWVCSNNRIVTCRYYASSSQNKSTSIFWIIQHDFFTCYKVTYGYKEICTYFIFSSKFWLRALIRN